MKTVLVFHLKAGHRLLSSWLTLLHDVCKWVGVSVRMKLEAEKKSGEADSHSPSEERLAAAGKHEAKHFRDD